jgi:hypothetical protein
MNSGVGKGCKILYLGDEIPGISASKQGWDLDRGCKYLHGRSTYVNIHI